MDIENLIFSKKEKEKDRPFNTFFKFFLIAFFTIICFLIFYPFSVYEHCKIIEQKNINNPRMVFNEYKEHAIFLEGSIVNDDWINKVKEWEEKYKQSILDSIRNSLKNFNIENAENFISQFHVDFKEEDSQLNVFKDHIDSLSEEIRLYNNIKQHKISLISDSIKNVLSLTNKFIEKYPENLFSKEVKKIRDELRSLMAKVNKNDVEEQLKLEVYNEGTATIHYKDGIYKGAFKNNLRHGNGDYFYNDGDYFKGEWKNDQKVNGCFYDKNNNILTHIGEEETGILNNLN